MLQYLFQHSRFQFTTSRKLVILFKAHIIYTFDTNFMISPEVCEHIQCEVLRQKENFPII
jgi:hypothetical protein